MRKRMLSTLMLALAACILLLAGCGGKGATADGDAHGDSAAEAAYRDVIGQENISVEDALAKLEDLQFPDGEQSTFVQMLADLQRCSGQFVQVSEDTGNRYNATVSFYLASGQPRCSVSYDGYMGEIADGDVTESGAEGFRFETETTGDLYGNEQDFNIYFGESELRITWAEVCDYTLTRGDGSADSVQTAKTPYEESESFKAIQETVDSTYKDSKHAMVYDEESRTLTVYVQAPDASVTALRSSNAEIQDAWAKVVDAQTKLGSSLYPVAKVGGHVSTFDIIWVFRLDSGNQYTEDDYVLHIRNGELKYDYAADS